MYVADANDGKVYSYNMPDAIDARLASLTMSGVEIGEFSSREEYEGVVPRAWRKRRSWPRRPSPAPAS